MTSQSGYLPYRGAFGSPRPAPLASLALPPAPMPARLGLCALKSWRYVAVAGPELMLCAASLRIGPVRQAFWALWDRDTQRLHERSTFGDGALALEPGRIGLLEREVQLDLQLEEGPGVETVCPSGSRYAWTRKQGDVCARGTIALDGEPRVFEGRAIVDDTAAYYERHTSWSWCAGVGTSREGESLAWNLVSGVNDPPTSSERTIWIDGQPQEAPAVSFAPDLSAVEGLNFHAEAAREQRQNLLLMRSSYRQPFGTFSGQLPDGTELAEGYGVMEEHDVWW